MLRFQLLGVPYAITPYFWVGSAILGSQLAQRAEYGWLLLATWVLCVLVSIVVHELGHALAARRYGVQPYVELYQFGGLTYLPGARLSRGQSIVVSLAGPAAGFAAYLAVRGTLYGLEVTHLDGFFDGPSVGSWLSNYVADFLLYINGYWTLFNLLPILPLDGGQVSREVLGPRRLHLCQMIGGVCAAALCALCAVQGMYYRAFFLGFLAYGNFTGDTRSILAR